MITVQWPENIKESEPPDSGGNGNEFQDEEDELFSMLIRYLRKVSWNLVFVKLP